MKIKYLLIIALCLSIMPVMAQQGLKFGHIDTEAVFAAMPEMAQVEKTMEEEYKKQETQLTALQEQLKVKQEDYVKISKSLSAEARAEKEGELMEFNQRIQNFYTLAQQQMQAKQSELQAPLVKKVERAIQEVGDENGFIYIFEKEAGLAVYNSNKSIDVAPLVKAKLGIKN